MVVVVRKGLGDMKRENNIWRDKLSTERAGSWSRRLPILLHSLFQLTGTLFDLDLASHSGAPSHSSLILAKQAFIKKVEYLCLLNYLVFFFCCPPCR